MDLTKKRKLDENGGYTDGDSPPPPTLTPSDVRKILEPFSQDQLLDLLQNAVVSHPDVLQSVRTIADRDVTQRKLFVRGLGWETTSESLRSVFAAFGDLEEAVVILDKDSSKSKGYGFVTYNHIDGAILALKEPSKRIDGRVAVAQLASAGLSGGPSGGGSGPGGSDVALRKIYVGNVPYDMPAERLLSIFAGFGEIEEGPLGFDKQTGKSKGFALFVYKTPESAQAALMDSVKNIDGRQVVCKMASEGKKGKGFGGGAPGQGQGPVGNGGMGMQQGGPGSVSYGGHGGPGGYSSYGGGYPGGPGPNGMNQNPNPGYASSVGGAQGQGGYGGYGGGGGYGGSQYGGPQGGGYGGYGGGGAGRGGGSMYGMPPSSVGAPAGGGGYPDGGHYGGYPSQPHQPTGTSPAPRVQPAGGVGGYPNVPPYY